MRRTIGAILRALPFDDRSRRALDEAMLDWAFEAQATPAGARRWWIEARSLTAVLRAITYATLRESVARPEPSLLGRALIFVVVPSLALTFAQDGGAGLGSRVGQAQWIELGALLWPATMLLVAPIGLFLAMSRVPRARQVPAVGVSAVVLVAALVLGGWVVPWANQRFRVITYAAHAGIETDVAATRLPKGFAEQDPLELMSYAVSNPQDRFAIMQLVLKSGISVLAMTMVLLGASVRRLARPLIRWWTAVVLAVCVMALAVLPQLQALNAHAHPILGAVPWLLVALATLALFGLRVAVPGPIHPAQTSAMD